jgi:hypothetical protein
MPISLSFTIKLDDHEVAAFVSGFAFLRVSVSAVFSPADRAALRRKTP